jgi:uncharacterized membrane protein YfcA
MANGTNRIAIFLQNVVGVGRFHQEKVMDFPSGFRVGIPAALGAIAGAFHRGQAERPGHEAGHRRGDDPGVLS